ncbi:MAG: MFS transporter [Bifidobacteriaceae bacterium]|nr:MFS transporter [Bifidobacteriaceae bacterium]
MQTIFASLAVRNYRLRFTGGLIGNTGTWMQRVAQDWLVLTELTDDSGLAVGVVTALQFGPSLVLSPFAGLAADRFSKRAILIVTQIAQAILALAVALLVLLDVAELWHLCLIAGLLGIVTAFDAPANQTFVGELVPTQLLANAVALNSASFNLSRMVGPAAAGVLIETIGVGWVFTVNAVSYAAPIIALALIRTRELRLTDRVPRAKGQIRAGMRYVAGRSDIVVIFAVIGVVSCLGLNGQLTMAVMAREQFGRGAGSYGMLGSVFAVGALAGSLVAARLSRPRVRRVVGSAALFGLASGVSALSPTYWFYALSGIAVGYATLMLITAANATLQLSTVPEMRGRVMSLYMVVFLGPTPIGAPAVGWVAEAWGPRWSIGVGAIASLVVALAAAIWAKRRWHASLEVTSLMPPHVAIVYPPDGNTTPPPR